MTLVVLVVKVGGSFVVGGHELLAHHIRLDLPIVSPALYTELVAHHYTCSTRASP